jgi:hypothetical protein
MQRSALQQGTNWRQLRAMVMLFSGFAGIVTADSHQLAPIAVNRAVVRDLDLSGPNLTIDFQIETEPKAPRRKSEYLVQIRTRGSFISIRRTRSATVALDLGAVQNAISVHTSGIRNHIALVIDGINATLFVNAEPKGHAKLSAPLKTGLARVSVGGTLDNKNVLTAPIQNVFLAEGAKSGKVIECWAQRGHPNRTKGRETEPIPESLDPCESPEKRP